MNTSNTPKTQILNKRILLDTGAACSFGFTITFMLGIALAIYVGSFWIFFWTFVAVLVLGFIVMIAIEENRAAKLEEEFQALCVVHDTRFREDLSSPDSGLFLGLSEENSTVLMRYLSGKDCVCDVFVNLRDVLNVELSIDQVSVYKAGPVASLSGAAIGGAIFGGAGAIVGSVSAGRMGEGKVGNITLKLRINDIDAPLIQVEFTDEPMKSSHAQWRISLAEQWTNLIEVVRHRIDETFDTCGNCVTARRLHHSTDSIK